MGVLEKQPPARCLGKKDGKNGKKGGKKAAKEGSGKGGGGGGKNDRNGNWKWVALIDTPERGRANATFDVNLYFTFFFALLNCLFPLNFFAFFFPTCFFEENTYKSILQRCGGPIRGLE